MCGSRKEHTHPMEGNWEFFEGGGKQKSYFKPKYEAKLEFSYG